jgi:hypothetical protein
MPHTSCRLSAWWQRPEVLAAELRHFKPAVLVELKVPTNALQRVAPLPIQSRCSHQTSGQNS